MDPEMNAQIGCILMRYLKDKLERWWFFGGRLGGNVCCRSLR